MNLKPTTCQISNFRIDWYRQLHIVYTGTVDNVLVNGYVSDTEFSQVRTNDSVLNCQLFMGVTVGHVVA